MIYKEIETAMIEEDITDVFILHAVRKSRSSSIENKTDEELKMIGAGIFRKNVPGRFRYSKIGTLPEMVDCVLKTGLFGNYTKCHEGLLELRGKTVPFSEKEGLRFDLGLYDGYKRLKNRPYYLITVVEIIPH